MIKTPRRFANRLVFNYRDTEETPAGLYIDGVFFPYFIHPEVGFNVTDAQVPSAIITFYGHSIQVIGVNGEIEEKAVSTMEQDEEWLLVTVGILKDLGFTVTPPKHNFEDDGDDGEDHWAALRPFLQKDDHGHYLHAAEWVTSPLELPHSHLNRIGSYVFDPILDRCVPVTDPTATEGTPTS